MVHAVSKTRIVICLPLNTFPLPHVAEITLHKAPQRPTRFLRALAHLSAACCVEIQVPQQGPFASRSAIRSLTFLLEKKKEWFDIKAWVNVKQVSVLLKQTNPQKHNKNTVL